jgi:hypothetical protein
MNRNRVGVNNSDPQYTLDVNGDINITGGLYLNQEDVSGGLQWKASQQSIFTDSNVGIGTSSPQAPLHIIGDTSLIELPRERSLCLDNTELSCG